MNRALVLLALIAGALAAGCGTSCQLIGCSETVTVNAVDSMGQAVVIRSATVAFDGQSFTFDCEAGASGVPIECHYPRGFGIYASAEQLSLIQLDLADAGGHSFHGTIEPHFLVSATGCGDCIHSDITVALK